MKFEFKVKVPVTVIWQRRKNRKIQKNQFFCIFSWYKYVTVFWKGLWKAPRTVRNRSAGHQMLSIACDFTGLRSVNRMRDQNLRQSRFPTSKNRKKSQNHCFWPYFTCINMSVWPECLLKSLQIGQKHVCRPSNDVDRLYFGWSSL